MSIASDADIASLEDVRVVSGALEVTGDVSSLAALHCLEVVEGPLIIEGTTELEDLSGLENLAAAESLTLKFNDSITTTRGLGLERLFAKPTALSSSSNGSRSEIWGNHVLTDVRFESLREGGAFFFGRCGPAGVGVGNDALVELTASTFPVLDSAVLLYLTSHPSLRSLDGLIGTLAAQSSFVLVQFFDNPELDSSLLRDLWESSGLDGGMLSTCGNMGDTEVCDCPVTE